MNLNEPFNIISVGCVLGGGNSGSTTDHFTTTTTDVSTTRTVNVDIPGIPGLTPEKVTTTMPVTQTMHTSTDNGLGNGFNGGGILAFDHFFGPCGPDGAWGIGTAALVLRGNNDTEVIPEINLNFLHQFPGNNQVIVNAGVAVPLASHFADGCGDVGARVIHCFSPEWGGFIGVQGIFGGNTSLGECIFGITLTPGQKQQGGSVTVEQARALHRQDSDFWSHGVDTGMELRY